MLRLPYVLTAVIALAGCGAHESEVVLPLQLPPPPGGEFLLTALFHGVLVVEHGCVRVRDSLDGITRTVLWRHGTELGQDGSGHFLRNVDTGRVYRFGVPVSFGGGEIGESAVSRSFPTIARQCGPPYATGYFPLREPNARQYPP